MGTKTRIQCNHIYNDYKYSDWMDAAMKKYNMGKRRQRAANNPRRFMAGPATLPGMCCMHCV